MYFSKLESCKELKQKSESSFLSRRAHLLRADYLKQLIGGYFSATSQLARAPIYLFLLFEQNEEITHQELRTNERIPFFSPPTKIECQGILAEFNLP